MEIKIDEETIKAIADLEVQAMIFNMDIDWEKAQLVQKQKVYEDKDPLWLRKYKERAYESDRQPTDYEGGVDERRQASQSESL